MLNSYKLNSKVVENFNNTRLKLLFFPAILLLAIVFIIAQQGAFSIDGYVEIQKEFFFYLNSKLSQHPSLQYNLTQLGDALILFPLLTIFIVYAPKLWGAILTSSIITLIVSFSLKKIFAVPRPAAMFDNDSFTIIGKTLKGHTSLPSGHTITAITIITILLFAFMPKTVKYKWAWSGFILLIGFVIVLSRVGVGAHFPLDVLFGSIIGYISAIIGIIINNKISWWTWIENKKTLPIFMLILPIWGFLIIKKIIAINLVVFYFSLIALILALYLIIKRYVREKN
ncbi:MAG: phosphatase PAP2 family protein [Polaribacter sp.]